MTTAPGSRKKTFKAPGATGSDSHSSRWSRDYETVESIIRVMEKNRGQIPTPDIAAASAGLSGTQLQQVFLRWAGLGPEAFLSFLTREYSRLLLKENAGWPADMAGAGTDEAEGGPVLSIHSETLLPGRQAGGKEPPDIIYGFCSSPFGDCLIARTGLGVCSLNFIRADSRDRALAGMADEWPGASLRQDDAAIRSLAGRIFPDNSPSAETPLHLHVLGTAFQIRVWKALSRIPAGRITTYSEVARAIGHPDAGRAVGTAVGKNPVPYLIPCHRVIRKTGDFGHYGGGPARKKAMLGWEAARRQKQNHPQENTP